LTISRCRRRERRGHDPAADARAGFGKSRDVVHVERCKFGADALGQAIVRENSR